VADRRDDDATLTAFWTPQDPMVVTGAAATPVIVGPCRTPLNASRWGPEGDIITAGGDERYTFCRARRASVARGSRPKTHAIVSIAVSPEGARIRGGPASGARSPIIDRVPAGSRRTMIGTRNCGLVGRVFPDGRHLASGGRPTEIIAVERAQRRTMENMTIGSPAISSRPMRETIRARRKVFPHAWGVSHAAAGPGAPRRADASRFLPPDRTLAAPLFPRPQGRRHRLTSGR